MPTRRRLTWIVYALCALAVVEGLGFITWHTVRLERREHEARAEARLQEAVVLALWRMDSELTPIIAAESRRPYYHYRSFYNPDRAYTRMWQELEPGEIRVASPLLESPGPFIRLHFEVEPDGSITSPQAPTGNMRDLAESQYVDSEFIVYSTELLGNVSAMMRSGGAARLLGGAAGPDRSDPAGRLTQIDASTSTPTTPQRALPVTADEGTKFGTEWSQRQQTAQQAFTANEYAARTQRSRAPAEPADRLADAARRDMPTEEARDRAGAGDQREAQPVAKKEESLGARISESQPAPLLHRDVEQLGFEPAWLADPSTGRPELVLRRVVRIDEQSVTQGFWLDWPAISARLVERVRDLLPGARVEPYVGPADAAPRARLLASIPVVLDPGSLPAAAGPGAGALRVTLVVTWLAVLAAIAAIGVVLRAAMVLGDRRGRFVSAVTHELRTPLTTFCLYTEMLADGMVPEESSRRSYLETLKGESRRLARIVENVLDYARLGQGRAHPNGHAARTAAADLLARVRPVLQRRADQDRMELVFEAGALGDAACAADPQSVERILYNLVDNACKYASDAADRRIHVSAGLSRRGDTLEVVIRDHGPGIPASDRRRVFQSFHRARRDEHGPKAGIGLGLALSRALARELGGDLELLDNPGGATLRLTLPVATPAPR